LLNIVFPSLLAPALDGLARSPALTQQVEHNGRRVPVFFESVVRDQSTGALVGTKRFHLELWALDAVGLDVAGLTPSGRNAARFIYTGLFPFAVLILVSLVTQGPDRARTDLFFGKMKTPVGATPELELSAMAETARSPGRFDDTKLFGPASAWEFAKWDKVDAIGFVACLGVSGGILAGFWLLLRAAAS
jgi:hypothetical protein